jgi:heme-degrading monooxygenase HmoA
MVKKRTEFVIVWGFLVKAGKWREFERVYGPKGAWVKLFRTGKGYIRTELVRDLETAGRYLTLDVWDSRKAYLSFKRKNRAEYHVIDEKCASLTEAEALLGTFKRLVLVVDRSENQNTDSPGRRCRYPGDGCAGARIHDSGALAGVLLSGAV